MDRYVFRRRPGWSMAVVLAAAFLLALGGAAWGSHIFSDVPTGAFYHDAVEWIFNRAITGGCAAGLYCPLDPVNRAQMAVFLQRIGGVLTPGYLTGGDFGVAVDPDFSPVICSTSDFAVTGYPRRAQIYSYAGLEAAGQMSVFNNLVYSTDGGTNWALIDTPGGTSPSSGTGSSDVGTWFLVPAFGSLDLSVGTTYRFGVQVLRRTGTADATNSSCQIHVNIFNRTGATTPLAPARDGRRENGRP